ncbi:MAG TPA: ABC transporter ATP-binding protein [Pseudonocardia sp.]|uniref:ABC transporter ATP-binding protein n=1 Tax=Pseudonocardia sp. TaxID=60912 RepID=UPI002D066025|nr:ABC transporter ATP-binding protein [Pseudonocardia sp.]HTF54315.1 ABC transporter ATP-binding protein [Pseudonocardia sp.]
MTSQRRSARTNPEPVLDVRDLRVTYRSGPALDGFSCTVAPGEIVALVGESGSGKTTAALAALALLPPAAQLSGTIRLAGQDVRGLRGEALRRLRGGAAGMVFQEPMTALNPLLTIGNQLAEAIRNHDPERRGRGGYREESLALLRRVGLREPDSRLRHYPHQLSGRQRQRVMIAMAIAARPKLIIADEPTTALDVTAGQQTLDLLDGSPALLALSEVVVDFGGRRALDSVSLTVHAGEILGLVGESGSGKTTVGNCALGLVAPHTGAVRVFGAPLPRGTGRRARAVRRRIGAVFQDPASSLDPRMTVAQTVAEPLAVHTRTARRQRLARVRELLDAVELPTAMLHRYGPELSGGQRQRVSLARALALEPDLLIADEPTSALDVSVQASVLELLGRLHHELRFGCLFISHDLAVVDSLCDRVAVMRSGRVVEQGPRAEVLRSPTHPYTRELLLSSPVPDPGQRRERRARRLSEADPAAPPRPAA